MPEQGVPPEAQPKEPSPATLAAWEARAFMLEYAATPKDTVESEVALQKANEAFGRMYQHSYDYMHDLVSARSGEKPEVVADLLQEVYTRAYKGLPRFRGRSDSGELVQVTTWLTRIAYNRISTHFERKAKDRRFNADLPIEDLLEEQLPAGSKDAVDAAIEQIELREAVADALASLSPRVRAAVELRYLRDHPFAEVGRILGITESAAKVRDHRGRKELEEKHPHLKNFLNKRSGKESS